jgi:hypothetical protein
MHLKDFDLDTYLFEEKAKNLGFKDRQRIEMQLKTIHLVKHLRARPDLATLV